MAQPNLERSSPQGDGFAGQSNFSGLLSGQPSAAKPVLKRSGSASSIVTMKPSGDGWTTTGTNSKGVAASLKAAMSKQVCQPTGLGSTAGSKLGGMLGLSGSSPRNVPMGGGLSRTQKTSKTKGIIDAALAGDIAALKGLVESSGSILPSSALDLSGRDGQGKSALMYAVTSGCKEVVEYILKKKVDVNAVDNVTKSALHHCSKRVISRRASEHDAEQQDIVRLLLAYRAILESRDANGCTPLMCAVVDGDVAVAKCLMECKADVLVRDTEGQTCLDLAVLLESNFAEVLRKATADQERNGLGPPVNFPRPDNGAFTGGSMIKRETGSTAAGPSPISGSTASTTTRTPVDRSDSSDGEVEFGGPSGSGGSGQGSPKEQKKGRNNKPDNGERTGDGEAAENKEKKEKKEKKDKKEKKEKKGDDATDGAKDGDAQADAAKSDGDRKRKEEEAAAAQQKLLDNLQSAMKESADEDEAIDDRIALLKAALQEAQEAGLDGKEVQDAEARTKELKKVGKAVEKLRQAMTENDVKALQKAIGKADEGAIPPKLLAEAKQLLAEEEPRQEAREKLQAMRENATSEGLKEAIAQAKRVGVPAADLASFETLLEKLEKKDEIEARLKKATEERDVETLQKVIELATEVGADSKLIKKATKVLKEEEPKIRAREQLAQACDSVGIDALKGAIQLAKEVGLLESEYKQAQEILDREIEKERVMALIKTTLQECQSVDMTDIDALREAKEKLSTAITDAHAAGVPETCLVDADMRRKKIHNTIEDLKGSIRVYCRIRPLSSKEKDQGDLACTNRTSTMTLEIDNKDEGKSTFTFDAVFTPGTQEEVFEDCRDLIQSALDGYNVTIFAYGQTGAGKTFTMYGAPGMEGTTPRTIKELYRVAALQSVRFEYTISASMLELYRNDLVDLLNKASAAATKKPLNVKTDKAGRISIENIIEETCETAEDLTALLERGNEQRTVAATQMNSESSRSHLVLMVKIKSVNKETGENLFGKILMCDLAGSERLKKSQVTEDMQKEAIEINKSLTALGDVIEALTKAQKSVPYRNHKLTQLMQDSLGGTAKTLMFVNCSPANSNLDETLMSLKYATRAKKITNTAKKGTS